jgi:hypothetical protein
MGCDFDRINDMELIRAHRDIMRLLKKRGIIHSKNVIGDLGEYLAIRYYCDTPNLPKLQPAPPNTKNVDAISINGDRYNIKATTSRVTSVFWGLNSPSSKDIEHQKFEFVVVVMLDDSLSLKRINELTWEQFLKYKRWNSRMGAWNLPSTQELLKSTRTVYST